MTAAAIIEDARTREATFTILGGAGFVGSHLARFLDRHALGHTAPARGDESIFTRPLGHVIYCIGLTADYARRPFDTVEAHVGFLSRVLQQCDFQSLVYLSSTRLYDSAGPRGRENEALLLNPQIPRHLFDLSKALGEALCVHGGKNARVTRLASVYAEDLSGSNFLHELIRIGATQRSAALDTSPSLARDYVDVEDVCTSLVAIAIAGRRPIYNVASGRNVTNQEIFDQIARITGCQMSGLRPATADVFPLIDVGAIAEDFGIYPRSVLDRLSEIVALRRQGA
jgi:nucleoside-diphosphate-sugar epimerase